MKSRVPVSAQWRSSKSEHHRARSGPSARRTCAMRRTAARGRCPPARRPAAPAARARSSARSSASGTCSRRVGGHLRAGRRARRPSTQAAAGADHLAQRPERDPLRRTPVSGPGATRPSSTTPSVYLLNSHARRLLPMPAGTDDRHEARPPLARGGVEQVLEQAHLVVAAHERRLQALGAAATADLRHDAQRTPRGDRGRLALEVLLAGRLERDAVRRGAHGRLTDQHGAGRGHRLEPGGGVDEVARDHPLVRGADGDGGLAGEHAGPGLDAGAQLAHRVDQLQRGPHRALRVVLARDRRAPDGHHRIADELLDGAAVPGDDVARRGRSSASASRAPPPRRGPRRTG